MLEMRRATKDDRWRIFKWRNDPAMVKVSGSQHPVTSKEHFVWFDRLLADCNKQLWIAEPTAGMVRLENDGDTTWVTIMLTPEFRGKGYGVWLLRWANKQAVESWPKIQRMAAFIRRDNPASLATFKKAGFSELPAQINEELTLLIQRIANV